MHTISQLSEIVNKHLAEIEYPQQPDGLYAPIRYTLDGGGKRLRPVLTLAVCEALGQNLDTAINQAIGVEMFHNFTLLHDDVMDNADTRRGKPTVHCKWNTASAILSGDAMLTLATQFVVRSLPDDVQNRALALFNTTAMEIYQGQQYDMDFEQRDDVTITEYIEMIRLKTSVLLGCACAMGALVAGASVDVQNAFYAYGEKLGLAFQLQDDYLDTFGDQATFGKKIGGDIVNDKKTWLLISTLSRDDSGEARRLICSDIAPADKISRMSALYERLGVKADCRKLIDKYIAEAQSIIECIEIGSESKEFFISLARKSATRDH